MRVARTVLRGGGGGDVTFLPDTNCSDQLEGLAGWSCYQQLHLAQLIFLGAKNNWGQSLIV